MQTMVKSFQNSNDLILSCDACYFSNSVLLHLCAWFWSIRNEIIIQQCVMGGSENLRPLFCLYSTNHTYSCFVFSNGVSVDTAELDDYTYLFWGAAPCSKSALICVSFCGNGWMHGWQMDLYTAYLSIVFPAEQSEWYKAGVLPLFQLASHF